MSKNLKFPLESHANGEGKLARRRNIKSASFHARSDSEIYTTEYPVLHPFSCDVLFSFRSSSYQCGCPIAAVSAHCPAEHVMTDMGCHTVNSYQSINLAAWVKYCYRDELHARHPSHRHIKHFQLYLVMSSSGLPPFVLCFHRSRSLPLSCLPTQQQHHEVDEGEGKVDGECSGLFVRKPTQEFESVMAKGGRTRRRGGS